MLREVGVIPTSYLKGVNSLFLFVLFRKKGIRVLKIYELHIDKRSHHIRVYNFTDRGKKAIEAFARRMIHWGYLREGRDFRKAPLKVFAASNVNRDEYRFHINQMDDFLSHLRQNHIEENQYVINETPLRIPEKVDLPVFEQWKPRENQLEPIEYIIKDDGPRQRLVCLYTGAGKSFLTMYATSKIKHRFVLVARPMYIDKWILDVQKTYDIPVEDILVVKGGASLMALLAMSKAGQLKERVILISNKTILNFLKNYERFGDGLSDMGYDVMPDELFQILGGGIRVIDEVHQDFHFNFKLDLYTHTERSVSLSATMLSDDVHIQKMYEIAYPKKDRYEGEEYQPYINSVAVLYQFRNPKKIRYTDFSGRTYSHHVLEQSVIKNPEILKNYLEMITEHVKTYYVNGKERKPGDKFIIFCASIDMCTRVTKHLKNTIPQFSIERYVEDDPYENLMEPDGRVSTLLSAGTAVDIDQLTCTFLTTAVNSSVSNVQGFGRLRMLKDGRNPLFVYFSDMNNPKHMDYHNKKKEIIKPRSLNFREMYYGALI